MYMENTIDFTSKFHKWGFIFMGMIGLFVGSRAIYLGDSQNDWLLVIDIVFIIGGIMAIVYGLLLFRSSPKIQLDDEGLFFREGIFKKPETIVWDNVKKITYSPYKIEFYLTDGSFKPLKLKSTAETTLLIKGTVRKFSEIKQIDIVGR